MSKSTMASIMAEQVLCCALPTWTGLTLSMSCHLLQYTHLLSLFRIKEKLRSGELMTTGDEGHSFSIKIMFMTLMTLEGTFS